MVGRGWATGPRFLPLPGGPRAWHVAWQGRVEWRRQYFYPLEERDQSMVHEEVLAASAGLIGFHVANRDQIRHTFVIEGTNVKLEVPASKERRVEVELAAGEYRFFCDVPGHERMEGVLTVR